MDINALSLVAALVSAAEGEGSSDLSRIPEVVSVAQQIRGLRQRHVGHSVVVSLIAAGRGVPALPPLPTLSERVAFFAASFFKPTTTLTAASLGYIQVHRRVFKQLAALIAAANGVDDQLYHASSQQNAWKRKRAESPTRRSPSPVRSPAYSMSASDLEFMPADAQQAALSLLMDPTTSPLAVYLLNAFPPSFITSNIELHKHILSGLQKQSSTSTEVFNMIQPPYYNLNPTQPLPPYITSAIIFLIESGEVQITPILKSNPPILAEVLTSINDSWTIIVTGIEAVFDKHPGSIGFSRRGSSNSSSEILAQQEALSKSMIASKAVLKVASLCGVIIASSHSQYKAITSVAKLTTLKWLLFEIFKFFESIESNPDIELDDDTFVEGPLPLLTSIIGDLDKQYQPLALKLSVEDLMSRMSHFSERTLSKILDLALSPFGYSATTDWEWVSLTKAQCLSNKIFSVAVEEPEENGVPDSKDTLSTTTAYYTSSVAPQFVTDSESLTKFEKATTLDKCNCIALDCEWRPDSFKLAGEPDAAAATLQVAVSKINDKGQFEDTSCFVFGLLEVSESDFIRLIGPLFENESVLKLGFGFSEDASRLKLRYPSLNTNIKNMMDLSVVTSRQKAQSLFGSKKRIALNDLVKQYLEVTMEKRIRLSNWEMRPLTQRQLVYAANDTLALLDVYSKMRKAGDLETASGAAAAAAAKANDKKKNKNKKQRM
ncbi:Exonuclease mut-7 [Rhizoclosmatium sp. JEL0117]|nr:Exonuclease mut-7 [Rhizoclosmatium sp. JEL0117]